MILGITKERLEKVFDVLYWQSANAEELLQMLVAECTELDPWLPIESTPEFKGKEPIRVLLLYPERPNTPRPCSGTWNVGWGYALADQVIQRDIQPTHYKLLEDRP